MFAAIHTVHAQHPPPPPPPPPPPLPPYGDFDTFVFFIMCCVLTAFPSLRAGAYLSIPLVFLYPVLTLCKDNTWLLWPLICTFAVWRTTSFSIMFTSVMMLINNRFRCATAAGAPLYRVTRRVQRQQQNNRTRQRHQPGAPSYCSPLCIAPASDVPLPPQGLASLTSTIAPAAGGSIYAYFSSLNKVPTAQRRPSRAPHALSLTDTPQGWPLNYSFAFVVMSATLALHLGMVWKVVRLHVAALLVLCGFAWCVTVCSDRPQHGQASDIAWCGRRKRHAFQWGLHLGSTGSQMIWSGRRVATSVQKASFFSAIKGTWCAYLKSGLNAQFRGVEEEEEE